MAAKAKYTDQEYLSAIRSGDPIILKSLLVVTKKIIAQIVYTENGTMEDIHEVQSSVLEILFTLDRNSKLDISKSLMAYVHTIATRYFAQIKRKRGNLNLIKEVEMVQEFGFEQELIEMERMNFFKGKLKLLKEGCKDLLEFCWSNEDATMQDVAKNFNWASENVASVRKFECTKKLIRLVKADKLYNEYL